MRKNYLKIRRLHRIERGSTTVEAVAALVILFFILFAMLQIGQWCMNSQFCQYSAFYASKGLSLGYRTNFALRAARVAAINISGKAESNTVNDESSATRYMQYGDASGVRYDYWHRTNSGEPVLTLSGNYKGPEVHSTVKLENAPLLEKNILSSMVSVRKNPDPSGTVYSRNYSALYMEE